MTHMHSKIRPHDAIQTGFREEEEEEETLKSDQKQTTEMDEVKEWKNSRRSIHSYKHREINTVQKCWLPRLLSIQYAFNVNDNSEYGFWILYKNSNRNNNKFIEHLKWKWFGIG